MAGKIALSVVSLLVFTLTGFAWAQYSSLYKSGVLAGEATSSGKDTNILIMGLDSRLDESGNPLPPDMYEALHAGDQSNGGQNSNVLILLHVPGDGSRATSISIPRDDYVDFPGCPYGQCKGKIKQAYGLSYSQEHDKLVSQGVTDPSQINQQSRDAGRKTEIDTVRHFVGGEPVDHFVEITMAAFFQIARVVQPITVCVNESTSDRFSGANFHQGMQQINAQQAVAFVRQRRDANIPDFNELDRERRQQAFISSLAYQLKQAGTMTNPSKLSGLLNVAQSNIAMDEGLDPLSFAQQATNLTGGNVSFVTLPIAGPGKDNAGEDINLVNVPQVQMMVHQLIGGKTPLPPPPPPPSGTVDVVNASGQSGLAAQLEKGLGAKGYTQGSAGNGSQNLNHSSVRYSGDQQAATGLSNLLGGIPIEQDPNVPAGHLKVVVGTDFSMPASLASDSSGGDSAAAGAGGAGGANAAVAGFPATQPAPAQPPPGPPGGAPAPNPPNPNQPSALSGGGIPCVK